MYSTMAADDLVTLGMKGISSHGMDVIFVEYSSLIAMSIDIKLEVLMIFFFLIE